MQSSWLVNLRKWTVEGGLTQRRLVIGLLIAGLLAPLVLSNYVLDDILIKAMIFGLLAVSLDLAWGYTGILSLGHAAFFGFGAYIMGIILVNWSSPATTVLAVVLGIIGPALMAMVVGFLLFYTRSSDLYIAVITLSLSILFPQLLLRVPEWTGGMNGLSGIPLFPFGTTVKYYFILSVVVVVMYLLYRLVRSDFGRLLVAVRDNDQRIRFLGFSTSLIRLIAFTLSGAMAGVAAVLFPPQNGFISQSLPGFVTSTMVIVWVAIGGRGTLLGPFLGAVLINWISPYLNARFPYLWQLLLGLIFIVVIIVMPGGLYSLILGYLHQYEPLNVSERTKDSDGRAPDRLRMRDLVVSFGSLEVLRGLNMEVCAGRLQCLIGPNGAGKSTLVNAISGNVVPEDGQISLGEERIERKAPEVVTRLGLARTFQTANLFETLTVGENLLLATYHGRLPTMMRRTRTILVPPVVRTMLSLSGLDKRLAVPASDLGHGERKWLELLMVLCTEPSMVLLDEPTAGLTPVERQEVGTLLKELVGSEGLGLLLIEHDMDFVKAIADEVAVLVDGRIMASGTVEDVMESQVARELYLGDRELE